VNRDVAISTQLKQMGVGILIRDKKGQVCIAQSLTVPYVYEPTTAEAMAALSTVELCRDVNWFF
jgi:hypothetical protein